VINMGASTKRRPNAIGNSYLPILSYVGPDPANRRLRGRARIYGFAAIPSDRPLRVDAKESAMVRIPARRSQPGVNEQRAQDERVRRSQPGMLEGEAQGARDRRSKPGVVAGVQVPFRASVLSTLILGIFALQVFMSVSNGEVLYPTSSECMGVPPPGFTSNAG
jgi:hypothetical protein